jgi:hypothetical protein
MNVRPRKVVRTTYESVLWTFVVATAASGFYNLFKGVYELLKARKTRKA